VVGARPNLMKIAPLVAEMHRVPDLEPVLVHTGQHYDQNMSRVFFEELGIPLADYNLEIGSGTHAWQIAQGLLALEPLLQKLSPDLVVVVGDVNSTVAGALVASRLGIPVAHVEAGLRSFDRTMPEEINRVVTDAISDYLFTSEPSANENLRREGVPEEKIFFVGNVMIDTLLTHRDRAGRLGMPRRFGLTPGDYALVTLHRPSNVDDPEALGGMLEVFVDLQTRLPVVFPVHPRTWRRLSDCGFVERVRSAGNLIIVEPLGYLEFLGLLAQARMVLTDSGGIQEEATILEVPCLTLRNNTERPVTIAEGTNELVGTSPERILTAARRVLHGEVKNGHRPGLWDGRAAERIVRVLCDRVAGQPLKA